jgi:acyl carrier protein
VADLADGSRLTMRLHYGGRLWMPALDRLLADGRLEYLGRLDEQVKLRGHRIELREIELLLAEHPAVKACAVVVQGDGDLRRLIAYLVPRAGIEIEDGGRDLRAFAKERLPEVMVPSAFVPKDALPLTPNGKVDRLALALLQVEALREEPLIAPRSELEATLAVLFARTLGTEEVGIEDDFFALGGHSLLATQLISRIRDALGLEIPLRALFESPTVAGLSPIVAGLSPAVAGDALRRARPLLPPIRPVPRDREIELSFAQERLWFLDALEGAGGAYHLPIALRLEGRLDVPALERGLRAIVDRHEALRTSFPLSGERPIQRIHPPGGFALEVIDLQSTLDPSAEAERRVAGESMRRFDLANGTPFRPTLLEIDEQTAVLVMVIHHIAADGWSIGVLFRELSSLYEAYSHGGTSPLPPPLVQPVDFAEWEKTSLTEETLAPQLARWRERLEGAPVLADLAPDRPRPTVQRFAGGTHRFALDRPLAAALRARGRELGATPFMTLLAAFAVLIARRGGRADVVIGSPVANRRQSELEDVIGCFMNTLVMRLRPQAGVSFREFLTEAKKVALDAFADQDVPFERLIEALHPARSLGHSPLFQVMFAFQNTPRGRLSLPGLEVRPFERKTVGAKLDLTLFMEEAEGGLRGEWEFNTDLFDRATIERISANFEVLLRGIATDPDRPLECLTLLPETERRALLHVRGRTRPQPKAPASVHEAIEARSIVVEVLDRPKVNLIEYTKPKGRKRAAGEPFQAIREQLRICHNNMGLVDHNPRLFSQVRHWRLEVEDNQSRVEEAHPIRHAEILFPQLFSRYNDQHLGLQSVAEEGMSHQLRHESLASALREIQNCVLLGQGMQRNPGGVGLVLSKGSISLMAQHTDETEEEPRWWFHS